MKRIIILMSIVFILPLLAGETGDMTIEETKPFYYCAVEMTGSYDQHEQAFNTLYSEAEAQGMSASELMPFGIYFDDVSQVAEEDLKWQVGLPLDEERELTEPLVLKKWDYKLHAVTIFTGNYNDMAPVFGKLFGWMGENGYQPAGPIMQQFLDMPEPVEDGWSGSIKIIVPVVKVN